MNNCTVDSLMWLGFCCTILGIAGGWLAYWIYDQQCRPALPQVDEKGNKNEN